MSGVDRVVGPDLIPLGVARPRLLLDHARLELQPDDGLADLAVEVLRELRSRRLQRPRAPLAIGVGNLIEPRVLEPRQRRQQHQHGRRQQRDTRHARQATLDHSIGSLAREKWPNFGGKRLFTSLTNSLPTLNVRNGSRPVMYMDGRERIEGREGSEGAEGPHSRHPRHPRHQLRHLRTELMMKRLVTVAALIALHAAACRAGQGGRRDEADARGARRQEADRAQGADARRAVRARDGASAGVGHGRAHAAAAGQDAPQ